MTYFKMKKEEWKLKLAFYRAANNVLDEKDDIIKFIGNTYDSLKNTSGDELQRKLIEAIAELVHDDTAKERE